MLTIGLASNALPTSIGTSEPLDNSAILQVMELPREATVRQT